MLPTRLFVVYCPRDVAYKAHQTLYMAWSGHTIYGIWGIWGYYTHWLWFWGCWVAIESYIIVVFIVWDSLLSMVLWVITFNKHANSSHPHNGFFSGVWLHVSPLLSLDRTWRVLLEPILYIFYDISQVLLFEVYL